MIDLPVDRVEASHGDEILCDCCDRERADTRSYSIPDSIDFRRVYYLCHKCSLNCLVVVTVARYHEFGRPNPAHQMSLNGDDDGELEPAFDSTATDLTDYGASVDHHEQEAEIDRPEASEFGVDDRAETRGDDSTSTEQRNLVSDPNQHSLTEIGDGENDESDG